MSATTACPSSSRLKRFSLGKLAEDHGDEIRKHLMECKRCLEKYQGLGRHTRTHMRGVTDSIETDPSDSGDPPHDAPTRRMGNATPKPQKATISGKEQTAVLEESEAREGYPFLTPAKSPDELGWLGHYRVLDMLGEGGMGIVFRAEDTKLQRPVALKVLKPKYDEEGGKDRFLREARSLAAVQHDNVVTVFEVGQVGDAAYLAMEFLKGKSLGDWMEGQQPKLKTLLRLAREMASGLAAAHERGLIHRDIKPENIWLEAPKGRVKILDFGLAKTNEEDSQITREGYILGTPNYMSPEQARSEELDERSDLFSLGVVLYQLASGTIPFEAKTTMATLINLTTKDAPSLEQRNPDLPAEFVALVHRLLEKERDARPASAEELLTELEAIDVPKTDATGMRAPARKSGSSTHRKPTQPTRKPTPRKAEKMPPAQEPSSHAEPTQRLRRRPKRKRKQTSPLLIWGSVIAVLLLIGAAVTIWALGGSGDEPKPNDPEPTLTGTTPRSNSTSDTTNYTTPAPTKSVGNKRGPVKVFLLAGQSNMGGRANVRTLDFLAKCPEHGHLLDKIKSKNGDWITRDDVWVYHEGYRKPTVKGNLTVGFGESKDEIGPELLFGHVLGDHFENQVLLIKITQGPMSLAEEGRPPSSGEAPEPRRRLRNGKRAEKSDAVGTFYNRMVNSTKRVLDKLETHFTGYEGQGYEIAGFVWFQGWNDKLDPAWLAEHDQNLINLVKDLRTDLGVPDLPAVIGELGIDGPNTTVDIQTLRKAQERAAKHPEFKGRVQFVKTAQFWDEYADELVKRHYRGGWSSPEKQAEFEVRGSNFGFLYLGSGKILAAVGNALGERMKQLCPE